MIHSFRGRAKKKITFLTIPGKFPEKILMEPTRVTFLLQTISGVKAMWLVTGMPLGLGPAQPS